MVCLGLMIGVVELSVLGFGDICACVLNVISAILVGSAVALAHSLSRLQEDEGVTGAQATGAGAVVKGLGVPRALVAGPSEPDVVGTTGSKAATTSEKISSRSNISLMSLSTSLSSERPAKLKGGS